jgi:carbamoyl-phosphate synthase large subunit
MNRLADRSSREPTALVTGAGGPAGVAVIRALQGDGVRVVGADADEMAVGLHLADDFGLIPRAEDPAFAQRLCELARRTGATALVCTVAEEMVALFRARKELAAAGVATWLPDAHVVESCVDKWRLAKVMKSVGIRSPATGLGSADGIPGPWIVKPRFGRGSRHVYPVDRAEELRWALARVPDPIVQTRLSGPEFTVDALVDRDGSLAGAVPRWRLETRAGISTKGRTFLDDCLLEDVAALLAAVGLQGPANVQGFLTDDSCYRLVEVNPRFSGGLPLSLAAGADLVGQYIQALLGRPIQRERLRYRPGVVMTRYFQEVFEG